MKRSEIKDIFIIVCMVLGGFALMILLGSMAGCESAPKPSPTQSTTEAGKVFGGVHGHSDRIGTAARRIIEETHK
jgi:hypothetical protein